MDGCMDAHFGPWVKNPRSLYSQATGAVVKNFRRLNGGWKCCPDEIVFDIFFEIQRQWRYDLLAPEMKQCQIFSRLLKARLFPPFSHFYVILKNVISCVGGYDHILAYSSIKGESEANGTAQGFSGRAGDGEQVRAQHAEGEADAQLGQGGEDVHAEAAGQVDTQLAREDGRQCGLAEAHGEQDEGEQPEEGPTGERRQLGGESPPPRGKKQLFDIDDSFTQLPNGSTGENRIRGRRWFVQNFNHRVQPGRLPHRGWLALVRWPGLSNLLENPRPPTPRSRQAGPALTLA